MPKHRYLLFFIFEIVALYLYFPARHAGFVHDGIGIMSTYAQFPTYWSGISRLFNDQSLHPVYHSVSYFFYKFFGLNSIAWYCFQISLHALNGYLVYYFFATYFDKNEVKNGKNIAFLGALLFLISPYQTDVTIWKATLHYLIVTNLTLCSMCALLNYNESLLKKYAFLSTLFFIISILSHEFALCTPIVLGIFIAFEKTDFAVKVKKIMLFVLPKIALIFVYFGTIKTLTGQWIAHYGAATHLKFSSEIIVSTLSKYCLRYLTFANYLAPETRDKIFEISNRPIALIGFVGLLVIASIAAIYLIFKQKRQNIVLLFLLSIVCLLPVMNLFFDSAAHITNDRFGYLASIFFMLLLAYFVYQLRYGLQYVAAFALLYFSVTLIQKNVTDWQENHTMVWNLANNYPFLPSEKVYVLVCADSYKGIQTFVTYKSDFDSSIGETIKHLKGGDQPNICHIYMNVMSKYTDSFKHEILAPNQYKLTFQQYGGWFNRFGKGAPSHFENENYKVDIDEWNMSCTVLLKNLEPNARVVYQNSDKWVVLK